MYPLGADSTLLLRETLSGFPRNLNRGFRRNRPDHGTEGERRAQDGIRGGHHGGCDHRGAAKMSRIEKVRFCSNMVGRMV